MSEPAEAVAAHLRSAHADLLAAVADAADAVAADWSASVEGRPATTDRDAVVPALESELASRGLLGALLEMLRDVVDAAGTTLPAEPVAGPPYVVVTSTGPVLRATTPAGRLVVAMEVFEVGRVGGDEHETGVRYVRTGDAPAAVLSVEWR